MPETGPRRFRVITGESDVPEDEGFPSFKPGDPLYESVYRDLEAWTLSDLGDEYGEPQFGSEADRIRNIGSAGIEEPLPTIAFISRITSILRGAADGLGCDAAALYLLDDATTALTIRAMWGLDPQSLVEESRPLKGALADLEALCGRAVVLEDQLMHALWAVPEPCQSAVCIPVATSATILGTLWFFCQTPRKYDQSITNLMEIVAGGLASELALEKMKEERRWG
ncbi:MAG: GAF domain-containing protein [Pirellulales bacterium]|nr:GAF domain-containing protein [Pirellulales bacterium]